VASTIPQTVEGTRGGSLGKVKVRENLAKLIEYLSENPRPFTVASVVAAGVLNSRDAYDALQHGVRNGVILRSKAPDEWPKNRTVYRWTGYPFPPSKQGAVGPSFDALLVAWGMARVPPRKKGHVRTRRVLIE
jgi:hypothetical protein